MDAFKAMMAKAPADEAAKAEHATAEGGVCQSDSVRLGYWNALVLSFRCYPVVGFGSSQVAKISSPVWSRRF